MQAEFLKTRGIGYKSDLFEIYPLFWNTLYGRVKKNYSDFHSRLGMASFFTCQEKKAQKEATPSANQAKKSTAGKVQVSWQRRPLKSWIEVFSGTGKDSRSQHNEFGKKSTLIIS
jgi:hypothetical protein